MEQIEDLLSFQLDDSSAKTVDDWLFLFLSFSIVLIFIVIVLEMPLLHEVSNLSAHEIGSDFSRDLIPGKPDVYYQIFGII